MSVINQVLNQLEQRGAQTPSMQDAVRPIPVPATRRTRAGLWVGALAAVLAVVAGWQLLQSRSAPVAAVTSQPVAQPVVPVEPEAAPVDLSSGLKLSFELSAMPLPEVSEMSLVPGIAAAPSPAPAREVVTPASTPAPVQQKLQTAPVELPVKHISPAQQADAEFRKAAVLAREGRSAEAQAGYEAALRLDPQLDAARQALVAVLIEGGRSGEAEQVLREGLKLKSAQTGFAMMLARLQVERGKQDDALATLERSLSHAEGRADYQAFYAALLQRSERHKEALPHYQIALQHVPDNGVWLMGYGISLQAAGRNEDARTAYRRALDSGKLTPELQQFVRKRLEALK